MHLKLKFIILIIFISVIYNSSVNKQELLKSILENFKDKPKKLQFQVLHTFFNKPYNLDSEEGIRRYNIFKSNLKQIEEVNSKNLSYKLGLNQYFDLKDDEFKENFFTNFNLNDIGIETKSQNLKKDKTIDFDDMNESQDYSDDSDNFHQTLKINWTQYMNPVSDQVQCASSWAFGPIGAIEGNYNLKFDKTLPFSKKELVDCNNSNYACSAGMAENSMNYIIKYGIARESDYRYYFKFPISFKEVLECAASSKQRYYPINSYKYVFGTSIDDSIFFDMLKQGPIVVVIDGLLTDAKNPNNFLFRYYKSGIIENITCNKSNHYVIATGVDYDSKGQYLIARNSFSNFWGEDGNFRIRINSANKTCFMTSSALLPIVKNLNDPAPNPPECMKVYSQTNYQGIVKEICETTKIGVEFPILSFTIGKFYEVRFYSDINCYGRFVPFTKSSSSTDIPNKSIFVLEEGKTVAYKDIVLYSDYCLTGEKLRLFDDTPDLNILKFGNKISSIDMGINDVIPYSSLNYRGSTFNLFKSRNAISLYKDPFDKKIQSLKIINPN